jgi:hypothetical protein
MFDTEELPELNRVISERVKSDGRLLEQLRKDARSFAAEVRSIMPRSTTAVSLVASDGGNNKLEFDPFYVQLIRVTDSYGKQLCLDCVSPTTDTDVLGIAQFDKNGTPHTALAQMMKDLDINPPTLNNLSHMIPKGRDVRDNPDSISPSWVLVYRDLCEWAALYERICHRSFATNTLIVRDGLLRSKLFKGEYFIKFRKLLEAGIERVYREDRRRVFLVGIAKHSKVLTRYNLAMSIEETLPPGEARYVRIPREIEAKAYVWPEYARGAEAEAEKGEAPKFVAGDLFLVRFGTRRGDPVWAIDIFSIQSKNASEIFGYLLADAIDGFPVPFYPRCLQKAHEYAQIVDFDLDILQDSIMTAVRDLMPDDRKHILDALRLQSDVSARRYE